MPLALALALAPAGCGTGDGAAGGSPSTIVRPVPRPYDATPRPPSPAPADRSTDGSIGPSPAGRVVPCAAVDQSATSVDGGLPDLALDCLGDGPAVNLAKLRGKPLIVNIWAQWCEPCRTESPLLAELARTAPGKDVRVYGVDFTDPRPELARAFASEHGLAYPHLVDPDKEFGRALKVVGPPATAFVGPDGVVTYVHRGPFTSYDQLRTLAKDKLGVIL